ncbi:MAG TPA: hypothetical protein VNT27_15315 [Propionibacteriaceae bacterium]|nr:hypothetical protein [Propionibacteriaceae bacterium]
MAGQDFPLQAGEEHLGDGMAVRASCALGPCRRRALPPARTAATALVWAEVFVGSETTVLRVEGSPS